MVISYNNKIISYNNKWTNYTYLPPISPFTIRLRYKVGVTPVFNKGTGVCIDHVRNIWDLTYNDPDWNNLLNKHEDLVEVIGANTTNVTDMKWLFSYCPNLTSVSLFDTSNVPHCWWRRHAHSTWCQP